MNKKAIITTLSIMLATIITSIALVFTVGPRISALHQEALVVTLDAKDFKIVDNVVYGLKQGAADYLGSLGQSLATKRGEDAVEVGCGGFSGGNSYSSIELNVEIPEGVIGIGSDNRWESFLRTSYYGDEYDYNGDGYQDLNGNGTNYSMDDFAKITVSLPSTLEYIGQYSFSGCRGLTSIKIPNSVTYIGQYAFSSSGLVDLTIPGRVETVGDSAFSQCYDLATVKIARGLTAISENMFYQCNTLTRVEIPATVERIEYGAFQDCNALTTVNLRNGLVAIESYAFANCENLTDITLPASVEEIGNNVFDNCSETLEINTEDPALLTNPNLSPYLNVVTTMDDPTYFNIDENGVLTGLSDGGWDVYNQHPKVALVIPNNVTAIGDNAFNSYNEIVSVTLPDGLRTIGYNTFYYCYNMKTINIPDTVTSIGACAFQSCYKLTSLVIPNNVTTINEGTFNGCNALISITIPESVTSIGNSAFSNCSSLTNVTLPSNLTMLGNYAFSWCSNLTSINIPDSVTSLHWSIFDGCYQLIVNASESCLDNNPDLKQYVLCVLDDESYFAIDENGVLTGLSEDGWNYVSGYSKIKLVIPSGVTEIRGSVTNNDWWSPFENLYLVAVELPDTLEVIGDNAFVNQGGLQSIVIPNRVTRIGHFAFQNCENLTQVTMGNQVAYIGRHAFDNCHQLTTLVLPDSVNTIDGWAFADCRSLVNFTLPAHVTEIGDYAFYQCYDLKSITIPASVTTIGEWFFGDAAVNNEYLLNTIIVENAALMDNENMAPYHKIMRIDGYTVTFDANGGSAVDSEIVTKNATITAPTTTRDGYTFLGWFNGNDAYNFATPVTADLNLTAHWQINSYTITFDNGVAAQTVNYGALVTKPTDPIKANHTFLGWYTDAEFTTAFDFTAPVTKDENLYAKFGINKFAVTFNPFNGDNLIVQEVEFGAKATMPTAPIRENYLFQGWYITETEEFDFDSAITANTTVTAKWKAASNKPTPVDPETPVKSEEQIESNNTAMVAGIAGGSVAGLGSITAILGAVVSRKRRK